MDKQRLRCPKPKIYPPSTKKPTFKTKLDKKHHKKRFLLNFEEENMD